MKHALLLLIALLPACGKDHKSSAAQQPAPPSSDLDNNLTETPTPAGDYYSLDASSENALPHYYSFQGGIVKPSSKNADWDFSIKGSLLQTNSGASGNGDVSVAFAGLPTTSEITGLPIMSWPRSDFDAVTQCEGLTFFADTEDTSASAVYLQLSSSNPILSHWWKTMDEGSGSTGNAWVSSLTVYTIKKGDQCVKFQILGYANGRMEVRLAPIELKKTEGEVIGPYEKKQ